VVSRRARGVSVGVNLNPNNTCNWRCVYCQVPDLKLGAAPPIELELLRSELAGMLDDLVRGDYMQRHVPEEARRINDVAFSGNGEPCMSPHFGESLEVVCEVLREQGLYGSIKLILITNGSLLHKPVIQAALRRMAEANGEIWYKLDSATEEGQRALNPQGKGLRRSIENLRLAVELCPTWVQTLVLARNGQGPSDAEQRAYVALLAELSREGCAPRGVHLYGLARPSFQPGADQLGALPAAWLEDFAARIRETGIEVHTSV
jgi:wyosine [tRNA(Phe)-imidazoG37] synthetase (radical SAM superfamily)